MVRKAKEAAETELRQIYGDSEWYSARYAAGQALDVDKETLDSQFDGWAKELRLDIIASGKDSRKGMKAAEDASRLYLMTNDAELKRFLDREYEGTFQRFQLKSVKRKIGIGLGYEGKWDRWKPAAKYSAIAAGIGSAGFAACKIIEKSDPMMLLATVFYGMCLVSVVGILGCIGSMGKGYDSNDPKEGERRY